MSNLYFNHFYGLRNQTEVLEIRAEFGVEGYGLYLMLLETIAESETISINKNLIKGLSLNLNCDLERLKNLINFCVKLNLFYLENDFIFSNHLKEHLEKRAEIKEKRAVAGAKGGKSKAKSKQSLAIAKQNLAKKESKESKINKNKDKEKRKEIIQNFFENENLKEIIEKKLLPLENQVWFEEQAKASLETLKEKMILFYEKKEIKNMKLTFYTWLEKTNRNHFYKYKPKENLQSTQNEKTILTIDRKDFETEQEFENEIAMSKELFPTQTLNIIK
jgi:hypothetical protein